MEEMTERDKRATDLLKDFTWLEIQRLFLLAHLIESKGNRTNAAKKSEIPVRTFRWKMTRLGIQGYPVESKNGSSKLAGCVDT